MSCLKHNGPNNPKIYFNTIKRVKNVCNKKEQTIIFDVLKRNSSNVYSEVVLMSMMYDNDFNVREKACGIIKNIRANKTRTVLPRKYSLPKSFINFNAKSYHELLDFKKLKKPFLTEPPFFINMSNETLLKHVNGCLLYTSDAADDRH